MIMINLSSLFMCEPPVEDFKSSAIWFSNRVDLDIDERTRPNNQTIFILLHIVGLNESPLEIVGTDLSHFA